MLALSDPWWSDQTPMIVGVTVIGVVSITLLLSGSKICRFVLGRVLRIERDEQFWHELKDESKRRERKQSSEESSTDEASLGREKERDTDHG
jgi:hypothetical protein